MGREDPPSCGTLSITAWLWGFGDESTVNFASLPYSTKHRSTRQR